jgi:YggT family protein
MLTRFVLGLINFFLGLAEIFLGLRVLLRFFAANPDSSFVSWVYSSSNVLMQPFRGIFPTTVIARNHVVDFSAIFAMIVYGLVAMLFTTLATYLIGDTAAVKKK